MYIFNRLMLTLFFSILMVNRGLAQKLVGESIPFRLEDAKFLPLENHTDKDLEKALETEIFKSKKLEKLVKQKRLSIGLVDLSDSLKPRYASINGEFMMYAASLPKIAILLAIEDAFENHEISETERIKKDLKLMISNSNNQASTRMIDLVGYEKIESVLRDPENNLYNEDRGGGIWVGKRYASGGRRYPEPLKGISHAANVFQVCRFYYLLAYGKLVSYDRSKEMLDILKDPALHHKFVNTLDEVAPRASLFRKSGSWKSYHSDSILVMGKNWRQYILVALVNDEGGEQIIRKLIGPVETSLKAGMR